MTLANDTLRANWLNVPKDDASSIRKHSSMHNCGGVSQPHTHTLSCGAAVCPSGSKHQALTAGGADNPHSKAHTLAPPAKTHVHMHTPPPGSCAQ
jgi:hypothetical protein